MNQYKAPKDEVCSFLYELMKLLNDPNFDIEKNFLLGGKHERSKNTTTLLELDMDIYDVIEELKKLTISNYYQTVPDDKYSNMPNFHVFYISSICDKEIYVKVRIQQVERILCLSFHFAEYLHGKMPYEN